MKPVYANGLVKWDEYEIRKRSHFVDDISYIVRDTLSSMNPAWKFRQVEYPVLTPDALIPKEYTDYYRLGDLALRPETTKGSYLEAERERLPFCVWQAGKSYRPEQDKTLKHVRLKEFYQLEFQCIYSEGTKADYRTPLLEELNRYVSTIRESEVIESDRLPSYSESTLDIVSGDLEVCSCSIRNDFPGAVVLEVAFGLDRLVYLSCSWRRNGIC